jgi:hypothetical protein
MGIIRWFKRERIRSRALKEIRAARAAAPPTRQGQRFLAHKIEKIRERMNKEIAETCPR